MYHYLVLVERRGSPREFSIPQAHRQPETPKSFCRKYLNGFFGIQVFWVCMDPHCFGRFLDPDPGLHPQQSEKQDPDSHQSGKLDPDPHQSEK
jgi:hypothetical protein